ncbi:MAG TPA: LuxR C-terminal-related transcriptional regulator [Acidimicrobiales bacterium]
MLVGRPGLSPVMVGRAAELDRLAQLPSDADAPAVALIGGEAGIGKTRLVRELLARLPNARVLAGQADPGSLGKSFDLVLDAVGHDVNHLEQLALVTDDQLPIDERITAAEEIFADLAGEQPTIVVFDDLHWADAPSAAVFERLAEPGSGPALLLATYRPDGMTRRQPAAQMVPRLERRRAVTHLRLERLGISEVMDFLTAVYGRAPSYRVAETLHARTGGNPYFLEELLAAAGGGDPDQLCAQPLPWSLGEIVRGQLDELEPDQRRILEAAAVLGARVSFDLLATVTSTPERELIDVLRALVASGMLLEIENDVFSFRHALAREAIEADLLGREKRRLHEQALEALRAAGVSDAASIAHHAHGAGRYDEMVEAAREGARAYLRTGATYQALQLAELGLSETPDDLVLLATAARAAWLGGLNADAVAHAERLLAVARHRGLRETESTALRRLVRLRWELGDREAMEACTDNLIKLTAVLDPGEELGHAMASIAQSAMLRERPHEAIEWADRAIAVADEHDLPAVRVWAECEKGSSLLMFPDRLEEGMALLERVADEAEVLGEYVIVARALNNRVRTGPFRRDPDEARAILARMQRAAEKVGFDSLAGPGYWEGLATLAEWDGDLDAAIALLLEGHRRSSSTMRGHSTWYTNHEAGLALEVGDVDRAAQLVQELRPGIGALAVSRQGLVIHIACRRGDLAEARRAMPRLITELAAGGADGQLLHDVVSALLAAGARVDEARPLVSQTLLAHGLPAESHSAWPSLLSGQLLEAAGQHDDALVAYDDANSRGEQMLGYAPTGTSHVGAARCLIALGRLDEARVQAEKAADLLARWRGWRVDDLHAVQRRLGIGSDVAGPAALTPREREVVALLAEGLSNAELASRLFISPKTAAVHVSNILAKLGMTSRAEIAAFAAREGLSAEAGG